MTIIKPDIALALDPGKCTGIAIAAKSGEEFEVCYNQASLDVSGFWQLLKQVSPDFAICESFEFRKGKQHAGIDLYPRELIGILRLFMWDQQEHLYFQPASVQGSKDVYFSDVKLKELGLYLKGIEHGRSAVKHLLYWYYFGAGFNYLIHPEQEAKLVDYEWFTTTYFFR
jgi:hypothetical protein